MTQKTRQGGELTLKQAGFMLAGLAVLLAGLDWTSSRGMLTSQPGVAEHWSVGGIPLVAFSGLFGVAGLALVVLGFVKKR